MPLDARRVHFAGIQRTQLELVLGPVLANPVNRLYLLRQILGPGQTDAEELVLKKLRERLQGTGVEVIDLDVDFRDPAKVARAVGTVVESDPDATYRYNVSTGPRESTVAGMLAAWCWDIHPYLVRLPPQQGPQGIITAAEGVELADYPFEEAIDIPVRNRLSVTGMARDILRLLCKMEGDEVLQRELIDDLTTQGFMRGTDGLEIRDNAKQNRFDTAVAHLQRGDLARKHGTGRNCTWSATREGLLAHRVLTGV